MSTEWTSFDFILNGEFADAQHLRTLLAQVRIAARAECALLLVNQVPDFFQTLLYVSHSDTACEAELQDAVAEAQLNDEDKQALQNLLSDRPGDILPELLGRPLKYTLFKPLCDRFSTKFGRILLSARQPRNPIVAPNVAPVIGVLCIEPAVESEDRLTVLLDEMALVVNATASVYLRRLHLKQFYHRTILHKAKLRIENLFFDQKEANLTSIETEIQPPSPFRGFLETVLIETGSTRGGVFMLQDTPKELKPLIRLHQATCGFDESVGQPLRIDRRIGLVSRVFRKAQPFLFNDREDFEQMNRRIEMIPFPGESSSGANAALAVPIVVRRYKSEHESVIGVVNIEKSGEMDRPIFSLADYNFVQDAADVLAGAWTPGWNALLVRRVKETKRRFRPIPGRPLLADRSLEPATRSAANLPGDFAVTRRHIHTLLQRLCKVAVPVSACTVRVLSIDQTQLILLAEYMPETQALRVPLELDLRGNSPMAKVMRHGRAVDGLASDLPVHLPELESYISFPLMLESRCVGVVTFGSRFSDKFLSHHYPSLEDVAEAITEVFEWAQNQELNPILHPSARVFASIHALVKIPKLGKEHLNNLVEWFDGQRGHPLNEGCDSSLQNRMNLLRKDFDDLESCLQQYGKARYTEVINSSLVSRSSIRELVEHICEQEGQGILSIIDAPPSSEALTDKEDRIEPSSYEFCLEALRDLIRNAVFWTTAGRYEKGNIRLHVRDLGACRYGCITISNPLRQPLDSQVRPNLFRKPFRIVGSDRLRYGAFLAGWLVRSIGGDVHLTELTDQWFRVTVEIPLLPLVLGQSSKASPYQGY